MDVLFVISHIPDNRYHKRLLAISKYYDTGILYWNKSTKDVVFKMNNVNSFSLKIPADMTNPLKRIPQTIKFIVKALKKVENIKPRCIYVGNLDMLLVACLYKSHNRNAKIIYEIADLHRLIVDQQHGIRKIMSFVLKKIEKTLTKKVDRLVLTSMKFYDVYYSNLISNSKVIFMPNMPEEESFNGFKKSSHKIFTVGFIGWIRYKNQLRMLIKAAKKANVRVLFAGEDGEGDNFKKECLEYDYIEYLGSFEYAKDIQKMYKKIDCVYAVYDADMANVRVALPNKLYESMICEIPIIVAKNTYLSELVLDMGIGTAVSHNNEEELVDELKRLSIDKSYYESICKNCKTHKLNVNLHTYNSRLISELKNILG